jgi:hypothetical protein
VGSGYTDAEVFGLLGTYSSAVFMMTALVTNHFGLEEQFHAANAAWGEFGKQREAAAPAPFSRSILRCLSPDSPHKEISSYENAFRGRTGGRFRS